MEREPSLPTRSTGAANVGLIFLLLGLAAFALPLTAVDAATTSTLNVTTTNTSGLALTGYYTELYGSSGNVLSTGYTPHSFSLTDGATYTVEVDGYASCSFDHWSDTGSTDNQRSISITGDTSINAVLNCGGSGTGTGSSVTVKAIDTSGNALTGYYTALYGPSGNVLGTGYTPKTYSTTVGTSYSVEADGYGSCSFSQWSNGLTADPMTFSATSSSITFTAILNCGTSGSGGGTGSSVTVKSVDTNNNPLTGYYVALLDSGGNQINSGYTTAILPTTSGTSYGIEADSYGSCNFANWSDGVTSNPRDFTATSSPVTFTAVYNCGTSSGGGGSVWTVPGEHGGGSGTVTIYDHRIPAGYWADCFATSCTNPQATDCGAGGTGCTGPGASMWVDLCYDPNCTSVVGGTGHFADENGYTFTGLTPGATYYLYPNNCDLCHGSTHDVLFSNWQGGPSDTTNPLPVVANGSYYDAWYTCTNGCGGG
jgi:hypothetical protein